MTRIYVQTIRAQTGTTVEFKDEISANGAPQWVDSYGVIKTNKDIIEENITIPVGTNGFSAGPITIQPGSEVTVNGEWVVV